MGVRVGQTASAPAYYNAAFFAFVSAFSFMVAAVMTATAHYYESDQGQRYSYTADKECPPLSLVANASNPWEYDAMYQVSLETGKCTNEGTLTGLAVPCPEPLPGCSPITYPCCTLAIPAMPIELYVRLDHDAIVDRQRARADAQPFWVTAYVWSALGWLAAVPGVNCLSAILGGQTRSATEVISSAFKAAALLALVEFVSEMGTISTADWLAKWPAMTYEVPHDGGFGAVAGLEISYLMTHSRTLWLFAVDRILLATALVLVAYCTYTSKTGLASRAHAHYSVLLAVVCLIGFGLDCARFVSWRAVAVPLVFFAILLDAIMLPIWLVWLGVWLRRVSERGGTYTSTAEIEAELPSGSAPVAANV